MPVSVPTQTKPTSGEQIVDNRRPRFPAWIRRSTIAAVILFLAINALLLALSGPERNSKNLWNGTGSIEIAVKTFQKLQERPKVVLLGSSLMMYPFWALDKLKYPGQTPDIFNHRVSNQMADAYVASGQPRPVVYSFATFGQMISDAYLYVDQFLQGGKTPEYLVFGIAPRDFHDSDLPAPMSTYVFKYLVDIATFPRYAELYLPAFQDKADFVLGRICFFYGRRWHLQHQVDTAIDRAYARCGFKSENTVKPAVDNAGFMMWGGDDARWAGSKNEYKRRYKNIEGKDVPLQMGFLRKLVELCHQRNIKVIVINMPLTDINRELMPTGFYQDFSRQVAEITNRPGVKFVDLGSSPEFVHADFWDTSHLNHAGGAKLMKHVMPLVTGQQKF